MGTIDKLTQRRQLTKVEASSENILKFAEDVMNEELMDYIKKNIIIHKMVDEDTGIVTLEREVFIADKEEFINFVKELKDGKNNS